MKDKFVLWGLALLIGSMGGLLGSLITARFLHSSPHPEQRTVKKQNSTKQESLDEEAEQKINALLVVMNENYCYKGRAVPIDLKRAPAEKLKMIEERLLYLAKNYSQLESLLKKFSLKALAGKFKRCSGGDSVYYGEVDVNDQPHGVGVLLRKGRRYTCGHFSHGQRHGFCLDVLKRKYK